MVYNETPEPCFLKDHREVVMVLGGYPMEKSYFTLQSSLGSILLLIRLAPTYSRDLYTPSHTHIHIGGIYRYKYYYFYMWSGEFSQMEQACETHFHYLSFSKI